MLRRVKNDRMKVLYAAYVARHQAGAAVTVDQAALDSLVPKGATRTKISAPQLEEDEDEDRERDWP